MPKTLQRIALTPEEIADFPVALRQKIGAAFMPADKPNGVWILVGVPSAPVARLVERTLGRLPAVVEARPGAIRERHIDQLLEIVADDIPSATTEAEIDLETQNAQMRAAYLAEVTLLTAAQVREQSGLNPHNKSEPASRWKREKKIFGVRKGVTYLYPAFQFENGEPRPVIRKILAEIADRFTPWQIAFWFQSGNGWLDGEEPQNCLHRIEEVAMAAKRFAEPTIG